MGTRGMLGIRKKSELKGQYNHFDSYFSYLGKNIINTINSIPKDKIISKLNETYDNIIMVDEKSKPTQEQINYCKLMNVVDLNVGEQSYDDWYSLLRGTQGELGLYINGFKYMLDGTDFINDSLFCEYAYIINLDTNELEIYTNGKNLVLTRSLLDLNYKQMEKEIEKEEE